MRAPKSAYRCRHLRTCQLLTTLHKIITKYVLTFYKKQNGRRDHIVCGHLHTNMSSLAWHDLVWSLRPFSQPSFSMRTINYSSLLVWILRPFVILRSKSHHGGCLPFSWGIPIACLLLHNIFQEGRRVGHGFLHISLWPLLMNGEC